MASRGATTSAAVVCRAPFVTLEFDPFGEVQACCANALYPLGNVKTSTIEEIWTGARAEHLRAALRAGDLALGCAVCRHRIETSGAELPLEAYAGFPLPGPDEAPGWPHRLSFSLHNTCNLACGMCGSDRSSRIRSQRDHLPPLASSYDDAFFEQLAPFLEHCQLVDFVGGEPFLIRGHHRIWDFLIDRGLRPRCGITTNGTIWNARVERVLDWFDTDVRVSIDGMSRRTFEQVRVGASYDEVFENLDRFQAVAAREGNHLAINWSFIQQNWFELGEMMLWAEERSLPVHVMTVLEHGFGVQHLPDRALSMVIEAMHEQTDHLLPHLVINRASWLRQITMLEAEAALREGGTPPEPCMEPADSTHVAAVTSAIEQLGASTAVDQQAADERRATALADLDRWFAGGPDSDARSIPVGRVELAASGAVTALDLAPILPHVDATTTAASLGQVIEVVRSGIGGRLWFGDSVTDRQVISHLLYVGGEARDKTGTILHLRSYATVQGVEVLIARDDRFGEAARVSAEPVALTPKAPSHAEDLDASASAAT